MLLAKIVECMVPRCLPAELGGSGATCLNPNPHLQPNQQQHPERLGPVQAELRSLNRDLWRNVHIKCPKRDSQGHYQATTWSCLFISFVLWSSSVNICPGSTLKHLRLAQARMYCEDLFFGRRTFRLPSRGTGRRILTKNKRGLD